jgi:RND superfamily putative drug exporter
MIALTRFITAARTSWIVIITAVAATAALFIAGGYQTADTAPPVGLPDSAESAQAAQLQEQFADDGATSGLLVFGRESGILSNDDVAAITERTLDLAELALDGFVPPPTISDDDTTAIVVVPLDVEESISAQAERAEQIRMIASDRLPEGITVFFTGAEGLASRSTARSQASCQCWCSELEQTTPFFSSHAIETSCGFTSTDVRPWPSPSLFVARAPQSLPAA